MSPIDSTGRDENFSTVFRLERGKKLKNPQPIPHPPTPPIHSHTLLPRPRDPTAG